MYKLKIMPAAAADQQETIEYIAKQLQNPVAAMNLANEIEKCYQTLEENPYLYALCTDSTLAALSYRKAIIKRYVLLYKIDDVQKVVRIMRLVYGPSNYAEKL